jgi:unsaturated chondroitin disaccharide hydrolase
MRVRGDLSPKKLLPKVDRLFDLAGPKIHSLHETWDPVRGSPVFTVEGRYTSRSWTDWTQGFAVGLALLQFDATGEREFLEIGREKTVGLMAPHVSHTGVHDHGFTVVSTFGNLRRLMLEGRIPYDRRERDLYELALKVSGAVQAARHATTKAGGGYIYSFNGPHSLFADTVRTLRSLVLAHQLGHALMGEADEHVNLLRRAYEHAQATAAYNVYFGDGRDAYDVAGRVAHESIFNPNDGQYRCPSTQQGYSPFSTWTRGAAWIILGYAEQLEFLATVADEEVSSLGGREGLETSFLKVLKATSDYYIDGYSCLDGLVFWDTGAPGLRHLAGYQEAPSDPFNPYEPIDSSASAITAQGLIRLGRYLLSKGEEASGGRYLNAGLTIADTLFSEPYLSTDPGHQGLLLHVVYHRPKGWDHVPAGRNVPCGESAMWGDYHAMELALLIKRLAAGDYLTFFEPSSG